MKSSQMSKKILILWQIISILIITLLIIACNLFISPYSIISCISIWLLRILLVLIPILYLPISYGNTKYYIDEKKIIYKRGVFIKKESVVNTENITIITLFSLPITRALNVSSILVNTAGGNLTINFLDTPKAIQIFNFLTNLQKEGNVNEIQ